MYSKNTAKRPSVLFRIPRSMVSRCFADADIDRLSLDYNCLIADTDEPAGLDAMWQQHCTEIEALVTGWDSPPVTDPMLASALNLQVIVHAAGSVRSILPASVWESDIRVGSANDALGKGVAETTLGLIIAGLKGFFPCSALTRSGQWQAAIPASGFGRVRELYEVTIGVIGASKTGRHVIRLLQQFDADVILYDPTLDEAEATALGVGLVTLDTLMQTSDVVSLHAPALPELRHMLDTEQFAVMKDDAIFINTARGMLVNEDALLRELQNGRISAILDVTYPEPPATDSPLRRLPNVILLPHIAGALSTGCLRMGHSAVDQLLEFRAGHKMHGEITPSLFKVMA